MKSKKAEAYINSHAKRAEECCCEVPTYIGQIVLPVVRVIRAVEIAEQEAEGRVQKKAIGAFKRICVFKDQRCKPNCKNCWSLGRFIKEMSDDE